MGGSRRFRLLRGGVAAACIAGLASVSLLACTEAETEASQEDVASIQAALEEYAPRLAEAYAVGDIEALRVRAQEVGVEDPRVAALLERHSELHAATLRERLAIVLSGVAAEKEVAGMEKRIDDLLGEKTTAPPEDDRKVVSLESGAAWGKRADSPAA